MTLKEAAAELGVLPGTLRHQILNGKLRARKLGPLLIVSPAEVERYRREHLGKRAPGSGKRPPRRKVA